MTGSGSAYVGVFDSDEKAQQCLERLQGYVFLQVGSYQAAGNRNNRTRVNK